VATPIEEHFFDLILAGLNLGETIGGEQDLYDGGSLQVYEFGRIYFHPSVGAFEVHGAILVRYLELGAELSGLGYPLSDEQPDPGVPGGRMNTFEFGVLTWSAPVGVTVTFADDEPEWTSQVVVKLVDGLPLPLQPGDEVDFGELLALLGPLAQLPVAQQLAEVLGQASIRRVFRALAPDELEALVTEARANDPGYLPPDFTNYVEVDVPQEVDASGLADLFEQWTGIVEHAAVAPEASDPVVGTTNPLFSHQGFLAPALTGIGAAAAWARGADGSGIRVVDLEQGWVLDHEDLPPGIRLLDGVNRPTSHYHGTSVLGVLVARDDARGVVGIAPGATTDVISYATRDPTTNKTPQRVADMISAAARSLNFGDVLLLEAQFHELVDGQKKAVPVETARVVFDAIRLATAKGVIVVEAGGNGGFDLARFKDRKGRHVLDPSRPEFQKSNAIVVGGCTKGTPHAIDSASNHGGRIDAYAWGDGIVTAGRFGVEDQRHIYWTGILTFGGTSGASAIIAGVCLLVQHLRLLLTPLGSSGRLGPAGMRALLRKPTNGTAVTGDLARMPDLAAIIANEFAP
jgi:hypothetical protein